MMTLAVIMISGEKKSHMVYISESMQSLVSLDVRALQLQRGVNNFAFKKY